MTKEERELSIIYLEGMKENYIEGEGYERHPLPEYYAIDTAIKALEQEPCEDTISKKADNLCNSCTNIGCEFQSGIVRTECAFYMPPHIESDNCGNYVVQKSTTKNNLAVDCISRADLYNRIKKIDHDEDYECDEFGGSKITYHTCDWDEVLREIEDAPSVTPQEPKTGHWIPVSEGLPKKTGWYLITFKTANGVAVYELSYRKPENYWTDKDISKKVFDNDEVIAWMPLPEPYKAESEDKE